MFFIDDLLSKPCSELISFFMNTHIWKLTFYFSFHCSNPFFCLRSVQITEQIVSICFNHRINCLHLFQSHNKLSLFFSIPEQIVSICFNHRTNCLHLFQSQNKLSPFVSIPEQMVSICFNHRTNCLHLFQSQNKLSPSVAITEKTVSVCSNHRTNCVLPFQSKNNNPKIVLIQIPSYIDGWGGVQSAQDREEVQGVLQGRQVQREQILLLPGRNRRCCHRYPQVL